MHYCGAQGERERGGGGGGGSPPPFVKNGVLAFPGALSEHFSIRIILIQSPANRYKMVVEGVGERERERGGGGGLEYCNWDDIDFPDFRQLLFINFY